MNFHPAETPLIGAPNGHRAELEAARFHGAAVVQLVRGDPQRADAVVVELHPADVTVTDERVAATDGEIAWSWLVDDLEAVIHGADDTWTIFVAPGISDFGVTVSPERVDEFRRVVDALPGVEVRHQDHSSRSVQLSVAPAPPPPPAPDPVASAAPVLTAPPVAPAAPVLTAPPVVTPAPVVTSAPVVTAAPAVAAPPPAPLRAPVVPPPPVQRPAPLLPAPPQPVVVAEPQRVAEPAVAPASHVSAPEPDPSPVPVVISEATRITNVMPIIEPSAGAAPLTPANAPARLDPLIAEPATSEAHVTTKTPTTPKAATTAPGHGPKVARSRRRDRPQRDQLIDTLPPAAPLTGIDAHNISAWFGAHQVLDRVSLDMRAGEVTALIGPSGCGKSTFLRILNRMHEMIPAASLAGEVLLDGHDIYDPNRKLTDARREIGMVFQKPNPFPAMSIYDNVLASLRLTGVKASVEAKDELVESCLSKAGLWKEVRDRLRQPGGGLSGGQQQRLCIARALAIKPRVLLMDEPCSALDPTSTRRIEETVMQLVSEVTIVIVTHNMQQAARVSNRCAFFLAEQGTPGVIVEHGPTTAMFGSPQDARTSDYVMGRFG